MGRQVTGLHHVTATARCAAPCVEFITQVLGLHLVKRTVDFDDPCCHHLYFGDAIGSSGTLLTVLVRTDAAAGRIGSGQATITSFAIPRGALRFWHRRLRGNGAEPVLNDRAWGAARSIVQCPDGLLLGFVECDDKRSPCTNGAIPNDVAIRGIYGVTLAQQSTACLPDILTKVLGFEEAGMERIGTSVHCRYRLAGAVPETNLDVQIDAGFARGHDGTGTVHHIAFSVDDHGALLAVRDSLIRAGLQATDPGDRVYFTSVYARTPGGILLEVATDGPGFCVDEPHERLGRSLCLPQHLEADRTAIERKLLSLEEHV